MIKTPLSTMIGGAFWTPEATILGGVSNTFNQIIKSLFANNEQGFVFDPNDLSTMFQDAAGTIPVTGAGQPVGLLLDKSRGLVVGSNIAVNGTFDTDTNWTKGAGWSISNGKAVRIAAASGSIISQAYNFVEGKFYEVSVEYSNLTGSFYTALRGGTNVGLMDKTSGVNSSGSHKVILQAASGNKSFDISMTTPNGTGTFDNYSIKELAGNHAYQTTSASRPILRQNATTGAYYLEFDGSDDSLQTSNIDFTATDKVSLFTGVQKLRSSTAESILELGVLPYDGVGTFWLTTNALAPDDVWMAIAQSWNARTGFSKITPVANNFVFSAKLDFAGSVATDEVKPRLNGSTTGFTRGLLEHAGTGNFGNHSLYIGRRAGTSLPFNGHIYSLIGVERLTTDDETIALEKELAKRTGVTLSV